MERQEAHQMKSVRELKYLQYSPPSCEPSPLRRTAEQSNMNDDCYDFENLEFENDKSIKIGNIQQEGSGKVVGHSFKGPKFSGTSKVSIGNTDITEEK